MNHLRQILDGDEGKGRLDCAALDLATIQFPDLEPQPFLDQLNELAANLGDRLRNFNDGRDFVEQAQKYLFEDLGFHGNQQNYFDPLNSCLNQVLLRRTGIPITLSVMYMEVARRLHMPVFGIGLPRHFVLQFEDVNYSTYIDPFNGGRIITAMECFAIAEVKIPDPALLQRVSKKQIVMRMLQNLHGAYIREGDFQRAVAVLDLMISGAPEGASWYKHRGVLLVGQNRLQAARRDFEKYLSLDPEALDREEIEKQIAVIHQLLARLN